MNFESDKIYQEAFVQTDSGHYDEVVGYLESQYGEDSVQTLDGSVPNLVAVNERLSEQDVEHMENRTGVESVQASTSGLNLPYVPPPGEEMLVTDIEDIIEASE